MKLLDIQKAITKLLKSNFTIGYKILIDNNKSDIKVPTFFVDVRPVKSYNYIYDKNKLVNVTITYTNKINKHEENLEIADKLEEIFNINLSVLDKFLTIQDLNFSETDDLLKCNFTLDYYVPNITDNKTYEKIGDLNLNI